MDFDDFMDAAQAAYRAGRNSGKRGFWYVAIYEFGKAVGMLQTLSMMHDAGMVQLTAQQEQALAALIAGIDLEYTKAMRLAGNGHPKENPTSGFSEALECMKEDLDEIMS